MTADFLLDARAAHAARVQAGKAAARHEADAEWYGRNGFPALALAAARKAIVCRREAAGEYGPTRR